MSLKRLSDNPEELRRRIAELEAYRDMVEEEKLLNERLLLETFLDNTRDAVYFKDTEARFICISKSLADLYSVTRKEVIGKTDFDFYDKDQAAEKFSDDMKVIRNGIPILDKVEMGSFTTGENRWFSTSKFPWYGGDGRVIGIFGMSRDITERKRAEQELAESDELLKKVIQGLPAGILLIDANTHTIAEANPAALRMLGFPREAVVGAGCHGYVCLAGEGECPITDQGIEIDYQESILLRGTEGERVPVLKTATPIRVWGRDYVFESFIDIAAQKNAEEERVGHEKMETLLELAGAASHELNQPLQIITGYAGMILKEHAELPEQMCSDLKEIQEQVRRMAGILWKLAHLTRYETTEYTGKMNIIDIDKSSRRG